MYKNVNFPQWKILHLCTENGAKWDVLFLKQILLYETCSPQEDKNKQNLYFWKNKLFFQRDLSEFEEYYQFIDQIRLEER